MFLMPRILRKGSSGTRAVEEQHQRVLLLRVVRGGLIETVQQLPAARLLELAGFAGVLLRNGGEQEQRQGG